MLLEVILYSTMKKNDYITLIRPKQWVKNLFVAAPLIFGMKLFEAQYVTKIAFGMVYFCIIASMIYVINDLCDIKTDQLHPKNKNRPLASGRVRPLAAYFLLLIMGLLAVTLAALTLASGYIAPTFYYIVAIYLLINLSYSTYLKHVPLLEMYLVASGYVLRVIAGCVLLAVEPSQWIIIVTGIISILITAGKRRSELMTCSTETGLRKSIAGYNIAFIDSMISIFGTATIITYMLYTISPAIMQIHHSNHLIYTSLFVTYGVTRYILLIKVKKDTHSPTDLVTSDPGIALSVILWVCSLIYIFYF
jgi:decaprenyl-phosphate phosphoribosyltransferase